MQFVSTLIARLLWTKASTNLRHFVVEAKKFLSGKVTVNFSNPGKFCHVCHVCVASGSLHLKPAYVYWH